MQRQLFTPVSRWNRRGNNPIRPLPIHQFINAFDSQLPATRVERIESFTQLVHFISPPLRTFAIRAIITGESPLYVCIITRFPIFKPQYFHSGRNHIQHFMSVHPSKTFIVLFTFASNIFRPHIDCTATCIIISQHTNPRFHSSPPPGIPLIRYPST